MQVRNVCLPMHMIRLGVWGGVKFRFNIYVGQGTSYYQKRSVSNHVHGVWCGGVSVGLASSYLILDFKTNKILVLQGVVGWWVVKCVGYAYKRIMLEG